MPVELKTRFKGLFTERPELVLDVLLVPRGSGNRKMARRIADYIRRDSDLGPYVGKIVTGSSRVSIHLPITREVEAAVNRFLTRRKEEEAQAVPDVPGQLPLAFG